MPWARIPCDKLINLPMFGIEVEKQDEDFIWFRGPEEKLQVVCKKAPRVWFESVTDAHQAGAVAIMISSVKDEEEIKEMQEPCNEEE